MAEDKIDKEQKLRSIIKEEIEKTITEVFSKAVIPKGYIRCKECGEIIKDNKPCPYCKEKQKQEEDNDLEDLI